MAQKIVKKRTWAMIVYPDSAPSDWMERLSTSGVRGAISPLHDQDVNGELGPDGSPEKKKPHYHVILCYDGPTTYNAVNAVAESLNTVHPQPLESVRGAYRYLTHEDNPEKAHYNAEDIVCFGGFNPLDYVEMTKSEVLEIKRKLIRMIRDMRLTEYGALVLLLEESDMVPELEIAVNNTVFFRGFIESMRFIFAANGKEDDGVVKGD